MVYSSRLYCQIPRVARGLAFSAQASRPSWSWCRSGIRSLRTSTKLQDEGELFKDVLLSKTLTANKLIQDNEYIRCTIFDKKGDITMQNKDLKRQEFMKKYGLAARDFRKISRHHHNINSGPASSSSTINVDIVPSIVTRNDLILLNLLNIRALIKHDTVVIFDTYSSSSASRFNESHSHGIFLKQLQQRLRSSYESLPFEFKVLEAILVNVIGNLNTELKVHKTVLHNILVGLEKSIERTKLRYLLIQSKKVTQFHQKASLIRDLLADLIEQDDELNALYLTDINNNLPRSLTNHEEVELLLESYLKTSDEIVQTLESLKSQIKTSEEIINIVLDTNRNELMVLGLKFSIGLLSMGITMYIAALYGMNLENFIEESDGGMELVVVVGMISMVVLFIFSYKQLQRLQKITMSGVGREDLRKQIRMKR